MEGRGVIEEEVEDAGDGVDADHEIEASVGEGVLVSESSGEEGRRDLETMEELMAYPLHPTDVYRMNAFETAGPNPEMGSVQM